jgi:hypothetical protein
VPRMRSVRNSTASEAALRIWASIISRVMELNVFGAQGAEAVS